MADIALYKYTVFHENTTLQCTCLVKAKTVITN